MSEERYTMELTARQIEIMSCLGIIATALFYPPTTVSEDDRKAILTQKVELLTGLSPEEINDYAHNVMSPAVEWASEHWSDENERDYDDTFGTHAF